METSDSSGRPRLEKAIAEKFARVHGARIDGFLPFLISMEANGKPGAIAGLRLAGDSPLFLEQYLDRPVEQAVSGAFQVPVDRNQIAEIGNLVSVRAGAASALFSILPLVLHASGVRWVVCTATPAVRALLSGLDFPWHAIGDALPDALRAGADNWGTYYLTQPSVIAGSVDVALRQVVAHRWMASLDRETARCLSHIASTLRAARG